ncbi:hypothetical protein GCM10027020_09530 [Nocardioides salsibiostraticola]
MTDLPLDSCPSGAESPDASEVALKRVLGIRGEIEDLEVNKLRAVVEWIVVNEVDPATHQMDHMCNRAVRTSGEGSPFVTEFDLMEFAAVLGMTRSRPGRSPPGVPCRSPMRPTHCLKRARRMSTGTSRTLRGRVRGRRSTAS